MAGTEKSNFWDNPYWAPLSEPLKNVGRITAAPLREFAEGVRKGWNGNTYDDDQSKSRVLRIFKEVTSTYGGTEFMSGIGVIVTGLAAAITGGIGGWTATAGLGVAAQVGTAAVAAIGVGAMGVVAGPFVSAAILGAGSFVVGCALGIVPGVIGGTVKAAKHYIKMKNAPAVAAASAAVAATVPTQSPAQAQTTNERVDRIVQEFKSLPRASYKALFEELEKLADDPAQTPVQRVLGNVERMNEQDRVALIEKLQQKLSSEFGTVAHKQAAAAADDEIEVLPKIRFNRTKNSTPAGAGS
jgi:hypothetical protein